MGAQVRTVYSEEQIQTAAVARPLFKHSEVQAYVLPSCAKEARSKNQTRVSTFMYGHVRIYLCSFCDDLHSRYSLGDVYGDYLLGENSKVGVVRVAALTISKYSNVPTKYLRAVRAFINNENNYPGLPDTLNAETMHKYYSPL